MTRCAQAPKRPSAQTTVTNLAKALHQLKVGTATISGHADSIGSDSSNQELSERRANFVLKSLQAQQVSTTLDAKGYGETIPPDANCAAASRSSFRKGKDPTSDSTSQEFVPTRYFAPRLGQPRVKSRLQSRNVLGAVGNSHSFGNEEICLASMLQLKEFLAGAVVVQMPHIKRGGSSRVAAEVGAIQRRCRGRTLPVTALLGEHHKEFAKPVCLRRVQRDTTGRAEGAVHIDVIVQRHFGHDHRHR